jgi:hypothetical protein
MAAQLINVTNKAGQSFDQDVLVNGQTFNFHFNINYNIISHYFTMQVMDRSTGIILLDSIPLIICPNILSQFDYLQIGKCYLVNISNAAMDSPDITNLGIDFLLYWDSND